MRPLRSRALPLLLAVVAVVALSAACSDDSSGDIGSDASETTEAPADSSAAPDEGGGAGDGAVAIADFAFGPADVQVTAGTEVTWTNEDSSPHSIQDDSGQELFAESDDLGEGDTFSFTYDEPGSYPYLCGIHNYMQGTVTVS